MNDRKEDEIIPSSTETTAPQMYTSSLLNPQSALRCSIKEWQQKRANDIENRPNPFAAASAAESRERYRLIKAVEGKTVRPYKKHGLPPFQPGETHDDHRKRTQKERQRSYRNTTAETVRDWTNLSILSEEEKANHIREKNRERQRRWRQKSMPTEMNLDPAIAKALEDFEL